MNKIRKFLTLMVVIICGLPTNAQEIIVNPDISYSGVPRDLTIGGISVSPISGYEDFVLIGVSGLTVGQEIALPGNEVTEAVKRYWRHGHIYSPSKPPVREGQPCPF